MSGPYGQVLLLAYPRCRDGLAMSELVSAFVAQLIRAANEVDRLCK